MTLLFLVLLLFATDDSSNSSTHVVSIWMLLLLLPLIEDNVSSSIVGKWEGFCCFRRCRPRGRTFFGKKESHPCKAGGRGTNGNALGVTGITNPTTTMQPLPQATTNSNVQTMKTNRLLVLPFEVLFVVVIVLLFYWSLCPCLSVSVCLYTHTNLATP